MNLKRRNFVKRSGLAAASLIASRASAAKTTQADAVDFYTIDERNGRWWLITPDNAPTFSLALNHIDPVALRYAGNSRLWQQRYHNDMEQWLIKVREDLSDWGFNAVGWNQEIVTRNDQNHRHSRSFTFEEYQWLDMPYCHMLPFSEIHQWEVESRLTDFRSEGFADWCDYVARDHCQRMKDDHQLIGYWYSDCPVWVHSRDHNQWRGSLFDPDLLKTEAGKKELYALAAAYYKVTHDAIRRYDPHHLILGDRYEANAPLPEEVVSAALRYVDVLSFQCFGTVDRVREKLSRWAGFANRPIILADHALNRRGGTTDVKYHDPTGYAQTVEMLTAIPQAIGYHLCGAYIRNRVRNRGLLDENERPDTLAIDGIRRANKAVTQWVKTSAE